jgi:Co/Zn/Cd efflux system component
MKKIWKYKFFILGWIIVIISNIWYWFFGLYSGDLLQIIVGLVWILMSLSLPLSGMLIDWIIEDKR